MTSGPQSIMTLCLGRKCSNETLTSKDCGDSVWNDRPQLGVVGILRIPGVNDGGKLDDTTVSAGGLYYSQ
jgi:hypothetical protein